MPLSPPAQELKAQMQAEAPAKKAPQAKRKAAGGGGARKRAKPAAEAAAAEPAAAASDEEESEEEEEVQAAAGEEDEDDGEEERLNCDWAAHPASCIIGVRWAGVARGWGGQAVPHSSF